MVLRVDLGGPALEFILLGRTHDMEEFAAEIDGRRIPIRYRYTNRRIEPLAGWDDTKTDESEGVSMRVKFSLLEYAMSVPPRRDGETVAFEHAASSPGWNPPLKPENYFTLRLAVRVIDGVLEVELHDEYRNLSAY